MNPLRLLSAACSLLTSCALVACSATAEAPPAPPSEGVETPPTTAPAVADDAVFVSPIGDDEAAGTRAAPLRTLAHGVAVARAGARRLTLCAGVFTEPLVLSAEHGADRFEVRGSAECQGISPARSMVRTEHRPALEVFAVGGPILVRGIDFVREDASVPGESSVAGSIAFVDEAALDDVSLRAGTGSSAKGGSTVAVEPCDEPLDPRIPSHVGHTGAGATRVGSLPGNWEPGAGEDGGVLRFPRSSRCVEPAFAAGAGGRGGGASLALLVRSSHVRLTRAVLESTAAGDGGDGGHAQAPSCDPLTQKSCEVLDIGGGGGGAGGVSAAIVHRHAIFDVDASTKLLFGAPGRPGTGGRGARWLHGTAGIPGAAGSMLGAELFGDPAPAADDPQG